MQFSAEITRDDYRNYFDFIGSESFDLIESPTDQNELEDRAAELSRRRLFEILTLGLVAPATIGVLIFNIVIFTPRLDFWVQNPGVATINGAMLLFLVFAWIEGLEMFFRRCWGGDEIERSTLRDGFNLGHVGFDLQPEEICITFALIQDSYAWRGLDRFEDGPDAFYLFPGGSDGIIVPKRTFADESARDQFREFAVSRIGDRK